ncbi:MAG TPA: UDP-N-acetylmuramoyl-L-alanyl-D-glutamate--2,6-diaminopimelate ligase [Candidatus Sulfotelmatobacter sp.]|jgi:UDP-N-acetylmuramoyl-L-alanyl-D-glutamate--2,6-diaminopimelate ligase|nr:UDP-N-acetylmuramoyl-L-alanyl-D-glutamate--2,6-diaminopimelate ligase [Candidatus Sulfotelmatobacter sp.]
MTPARPLTALLADAQVAPLAPPSADPIVTGIAIDSRSVRPGDLFFALRGSRVDGTRFAAEAAARGAAAVVADSPAPAALPGEAPWVWVGEARLAMGLVARAWWSRPDESLTLVGVTGTKGKTTVVYLVEAIARAAGRAAGRIGTVGYAFAGRETAASRTTPEATDFYALLAAMRDAGTEVVAVEVSSHALALHRVAGCRFPVAAFLNLGHDHLEFHGSAEAYFEAKASLFDRLSAHDTAVLPADDPLGEALAARTAARVVRFGRSERAGVRVTAESGELSGSTVRLEIPGGALSVRTSLPGRFNVDNVAAACACGLALGFTPAAIAAGIESLQRVPGRLEPVHAGQPFSVLVDYAHTEESLAAVLDAVRSLTSGTLTVVFGCGGERDRAKRKAMGRTAAARADRIVLTSDNPRGEDPLTILAEIEAGVAEVPGAPARSVVEPDRDRAIAAGVAGARAGDAVLIAGKGHETTQTFAGRVEPFDDREAARRALSAIGFTGGRRADA